MAQFSQCKCALSLAFLTMLTGFSACTSKQPEKPASTPDVVSVGEADLSFSDDRMVDAGEDTDNPRGLPGLNLPGFEDRVLAYLKAHAADADGKVHLDFIVGTHAHSDHLGGFDTILADPDVSVGRAYLKVYDSSVINEEEVREWDNGDVFRPRPREFL